MVTLKSRLDPRELLHELFIDFDTDGSNSIDLSELKEALRFQGADRHLMQRLERQFEYMDRDNSGDISYEEFLKATLYADTITHSDIETEKQCESFGIDIFMLLADHKRRNILRELEEKEDLTEAQKWLKLQEAAELSTFPIKINRDQQNKLELKKSCLNLLDPTFEFKNQLLTAQISLPPTSTVKLQPQKRGRRDSQGFTGSLNSLSRSKPRSRRGSSVSLAPSSQSLRRGAISNASLQSMQQMKTKTKMKTKSGRLSSSSSSSVFTRQAESFLLSDVLLSPEEEEELRTIVDEESFIDTPSNDEDEDD